MIDVVALWIGRIVLVLMVLAVVLIIAGIFTVGFQVVIGGAKNAWKDIKATRKAK